MLAITTVLFYSSISEVLVCVKPAPINLNNWLLKWAMLRAARHLQRLTLRLILFAVVGWVVDVYGQSGQRYDYQIVTTDDSESTRRIIEDLRRRRPTALVVTDPVKRISIGRKPIYIAVGPNALRSLLVQSVDGIIVSAFTSSQAFRAILDAAPEHPGGLTAVYAEPSPAVQLRLISMLYRKPTRVGVILSAKTAYLEPSLVRAAAREKLQLSVETFPDGGNLNRVLNRFSDVPVILTTPDSAVYNGENLRNILLTTYRSNQGLIGFSTALVKAGALATTFSEIEDVGAQIDEIIDDYEASGRIPEPLFPKYFSTFVNLDVARSLNIVVDASVRKFSHKPALAGRKP